MAKAKFDSDSVIQEDTDIGTFIPPNPGWNYVTILNHPIDKDPYHNITEGAHIIKYGKWLLFVPNKDFLKVFRKVAKLTKKFKLTLCFKASGSRDEKGEHVFCIYCGDYTNISFVRKIANVLVDEGFLEMHGYQYRDGTKALFFKTDEATHHQSKSAGQSLTLYKINNKKELFVKEFNNGKPSWKLVIKDDDPTIVKNFEFYLDTLGMDETF